MRTPTVLAAAAAAAALAGIVARAAAPTPAGTVTFLSGEATRSAAGARPGSPERLAVGSLVYPGDVVETQKRTRLEIRLADRSAVRLGPLAKLVLESASFGKTPDDRKVSARLVVGNVWANVAKAVGGEGRFEVTTANAVAGVRGTTFRVDASRDRSCVVKVYAGTVAVASGPIPRPDHSGPGAGAGGAADAAPTTVAGKDKRERRPVPGPQQVSRAQWEKIVTGMMQVRVAADGTASEPEQFGLAQSGADEWEAWNRERDRG